MNRLKSGEVLGRGLMAQVSGARGTDGTPHLPWLADVGFWSWRVAENSESFLRGSAEFAIPMTRIGYNYDSMAYYRARYYDPSIGRFISEDPIGFNGGINFYRYVYDNPVNFTDPHGLATYVTNRQLGGDAAGPWWDPGTHTFTFSTNPDGTISATYSWGNAANTHGWNLNQPEDMEAAREALVNGDAMLVDPGSMDRYYRQAFNQLNKKENEHQNLLVGRNCKAETNKLHDLAHTLAGVK